MFASPNGAMIFLLSGIVKWAKLSIMILALGSMKKAANTAINALIAVFAD
jgi:hypothetical protein